MIPNCQTNCIDGMAIVDGKRVGDRSGLEVGKKSSIAFGDNLVRLDRMKT